MHRPEPHAETLPANSQKTAFDFSQFGKSIKATPANPENLLHVARAKIFRREIGSVAGFHRLRCRHKLPARPPVGAVAGLPCRDLLFVHVLFRVLAVRR